MHAVRTCFTLLAFMLTRLSCRRAVPSACVKALDIATWTTNVFSSVAHPADGDAEPSVLLAAHLMAACHAGSGALRNASGNSGTTSSVH